MLLLFLLNLIEQMAAVGDGVVVVVADVVATMVATTMATTTYYDNANELANLNHKT